MDLHGYFTSPKNQLTTLRCHTNTSTTSTRTLQGNGIIFYASAYLLTTEPLQTPPEIMGTAQFTLDTTGIYVPDRVPIASATLRPD
jgi:hypothetical protein